MTVPLRQRWRDLRTAAPVALALLIQAAVFVLLFFILRPLAETMFAVVFPPLFLALAQGILAALVTMLAGFSWGWVVGQLLAPPLLLFGQRLDLPNWVFPVIFLLLLMIFWNVARNRVPLYLTNRTTAEALLKLLPKKRAVHFADLGSGLGGTLRLLARAAPESQFTGLETAPLPFALSKLMSLTLSRNLSFRYQDIFKSDLGEFDIVYCFLSPVPMERIYAKARAEMKPGSLFISNSFAVPDVPPDKIVELEDSRRTKLLIWKF